VSGSPASCARVEARLAALVDGGLAPLDAARDRGHLEACAPCRDALARHERLLCALRVALRGDAEADAERVVRAVRARIGPPPRVRGASRRAAALLAAAAALLALALLGRRAELPLAPLARVAALERALERLPSWPEVLRGLETLTRGLS
jgi:anti-sigma factor RsiW